MKLWLTVEIYFLQGFISWVNMPRRRSGRSRRRRRQSTSLRPGGSSTLKATRGPATWLVNTLHLSFWLIISQNSLWMLHRCVFRYYIIRICTKLKLRVNLCNIFYFCVCQCCPCSLHWEKPSSINSTQKVSLHYWRPSEKTPFIVEISGFKHFFIHFLTTQFYTFTFI